MKAPAAGYRIVRVPNGEWTILDDQAPGSKTLGYWKTFGGARTAHYRLSIARLTGKPVSYRQARRAGNG